MATAASRSHPLLAIADNSTDQVDTTTYERRFTVEFSRFTMRDAETRKLSALYVARHGNQFLSGNLPSDPDFQRLVEIYRSLFFPSDELRQRLEIAGSSSFSVLERLKPRIRKRTLRDKQQISDSSPEDLFDSIDWHDFVVVACLDDKSTQVPIPALEPGQNVPVLQQTYHVPSAPPQPQPQAQPQPQQTQHVAASEMVKCPLTGQLVKSEEFGEHMRVLLLDPKWRQERAKATERRTAASLAGGAVDVAKYLDEFVRKRGQEEEENRKERRVE
jgi:hypothetical protein